MKLAELREQIERRARSGFSMEDVMQWPGMEAYAVEMERKAGNRSWAERFIFSWWAKPVVSLLLLGAGVAALHWCGWL